MQIRDAISLRENQVLDKSQIQIDESGESILLFWNKMTDEWVKLDSFREQVRRFKTPTAALAVAKKVGFYEVVVKM